MDANGEITAANPRRKLMRTEKVNSLTQSHKKADSAEASSTSPNRKLMRTQNVSSLIKKEKPFQQDDANKTLTVSAIANVERAKIVFALCILGGVLCIMSMVFLYFRKHIGFVDESVHGMHSQSAISFSSGGDVVHEVDPQSASDSAKSDDDDEIPMTRAHSMEKEKPASVPTHHDTGEFANGAILRSARAWKFSTNRSKKAGPGEEIDEMHMEELVQINNWRRRSFFVKKTPPDDENNGQEKVGLLLINAGTGNLKLFAMLEIFEKSSDKRTGTKAADIREMEQVSLPELDEDTIQQVCTNLQAYDVAFKDDKAPISIAEYREAIPTVLFPISITWKDESDITCTNIVALESEEKRQTWMKALKSVMEVKAEAKEGIGIEGRGEGRPRRGSKGKGRGGAGGPRPPFPPVRRVSDTGLAPWPCPHGLPEAGHAPPLGCGN